MKIIFITFKYSLQQSTMNKSQRDTYKKLTQNGLGMRRLMKIPKSESKCLNNENALPIIDMKNSTLKIHDRKLTVNGFPNPFTIPAHKKIFRSSEIKRKVKPIPFIMSEPKTICDIHEFFFKEIEGRPVRRFDDIKVYMRNLRDILLNKTDAAYNNDQIIFMNAIKEHELNEYNKTVSLLAETTSNYVRFIKQSFKTAKELEIKAERISMEIAKITDELDGYCFEYIKRKNEMFTIMYKFEVLLTYGKFLHSISPDFWRIEFDNLNRNIDLNDNIQDSSLVLSMASLDGFKADAAKYSSIPIRIYFNEPKQVIQLFENISQQCRNYMSINMISAKLVRSCIKSRDNFKMSFKETKDSVQDEIEAIKAELAYMEKRELDYKSAFEKLLNNSFYQMYAGRDNVKLFNCVQYVTSRIFVETDDPYDSVSTLMRRIELEYMELSLAIDYLDQSMVKKASRQMFAHDLKTMNQAHRAHRTLKEYDKLKKSLVASFEPSRPRSMTRARNITDDTKNVTEILHIAKKVKNKQN